jgi:hypothetical protein
VTKHPGRAFLVRYRLDLRNEVLRLLGWFIKAIRTPILRIEIVCEGKCDVRCTIERSGPPNAL